MSKFFVKKRNLQLTSIKKDLKWGSYQLQCFIPETYKIGLIKSLLFQCFSLCSDFIKFHHEIDKLKSILHKNSYPRDLVDKCIKEFLVKIVAPKPVVGTVLKKNLVIALPYLGKLSLQIRTRINRIMKNKLPYCNIRFVFQTKCKISNFFTFKDKIPSFLRSGIVYKFQCGSCNATYYGKTKRHFKVRMCEHLGISALTGKRVKGDDNSVVKNIFYSAITHLILKISQFLQPTTTTLKLR